MPPRKEMISRRRTREIVGYTRDKLAADSNAWHSSAIGFRAAAEILKEFSDRIPNDSRPFVFNAALSLELIFKAILAKKKLPIPNGRSGHNLRNLCLRGSVKLSGSQMLTLDLLGEMIIWAGRYPAPKTSEEWDKYRDQTFEKHVIRKSNNPIANPKTFPNWENYLKIWDVCIAGFETA